MPCSRSIVHSLSPFPVCVRACRSFTSSFCFILFVMPHLLLCDDNNGGIGCDGGKIAVAATTAIRTFVCFILSTIDI